MDRTSIDELYRFTDYSWRTYEELVRPLGDELLTRPAPGSGWPALRDALVHTNWAYIRWLANPNATTEKPVVVIETWDELDAYRRRLRDHFRASVDAFDDDELAVVRDMNVDGETLRYSRADIFVHVLIHERQHHGDLNTLLYQHGIEPPVVEYRFSLPDRGA